MTDDREINELFEEMMYGSSETLSSIVYGYGRIGTGGQRVVRGMIERLREPGRMERLQIRERRTAGHFEMVIVYAPWKPHWSAEGFLPVVRQNSVRFLLGSCNVVTSRSPVKPCQSLTLLDIVDFKGSQTRWSFGERQARQCEEVSRKLSSAGRASPEMRR